MLEPSVIVYYVDNLSKSHQFYQSLLGIKPEESSPVFVSFKLSNGMAIGLKDKHSLPSQPNGLGSSELAFVVENRSQVDQLYSDWQEMGINVLEPPQDLSFAYTFTALDPDGHCLRVAAMSK